MKLRMEASDGHGHSETRELDIAVRNVAPTLSDLTTGGASGGACSTGPKTVTLSFTFTDPAGSADTYAGTIDWGDGSPATAFSSSAVSTSHAYGPGTFEIKVNVSDDDAGAAPAKKAPVSLRWLMSDIKRPVNADGSSIFLHGVVIPVRVKITDCAGQPVRGLVPKLRTTLVNPNTPAGFINELPLPFLPQTGDALRFEPLVKAYVLRFPTRSLADSNAKYEFSVSEPNSSPSHVSELLSVKSFGAIKPPPHEDDD